MKEIPLTQGKVALVDDIDYEYLNQWKWYAFKHRQNYYAARKVGSRGKQLIILMHRIIMCTPKGLETDHKNGNGLDNRRSNLRMCTRQENGRNRKPNVNYKSSIYKGVSKVGDKWEASIKVNNKQVHLGIFTSEINAAKEYNFAAIRYFHEFAHINVIPHSKTYPV